MEAQAIILVFSFVLLLLMGVPIAIAIGLSTWLAVLSLGDVPSCYIIAQRMSTGIASFPLLAIPFFILAGILKKLISPLPPRGGWTHSPRSGA